MQIGKSAGKAAAERRQGHRGVHINELESAGRTKAGSRRTGKQVDDRDRPAAKGAMLPAVSRDTHTHTLQTSHQLPRCVVMLLCRNLSLVGPQLKSVSEMVDHGVAKESGCKAHRMRARRWQRRTRWTPK